MGVTRYCHEVPCERIQVMQAAQVPEVAGDRAGVFNLVMGCGSGIGAALTGHPDVAAISFTGSERVGRDIALDCAQAMKKLQLGMGDKNLMVGPTGRIWTWPSLPA